MPVTTIRHALAVAAVCLVTAGVTGRPAARAEETSTAEATVDVMNKLWGSHPGIRANHAKGIVVEGSFIPTPTAATLSRASLFQGGPVAVTVRFSNSTGIPNLPDGSPDANPHGMSMKFHVPGGADMDVVTNSLKFFPVSTGEAFLELLTAISESGPDSPKPTKADRFIAEHPTVPASFGTIATPVSFAQETYYGIDAFVFVNAAGQRQPFRFQFVPVAGAAHLSAADAARQAPDFLMDELPARLVRGPVAFRMVAQLADPGDQTRDPAQAWPDDRRTVDLGTIEITRPSPDSAALQKTLLLLPNNVPDGIDVSDDPLIQARSSTYPISFSRRLQ
jgi:catalase